MCNKNSYYHSQVFINFQIKIILAIALFSSCSCIIIIAISIRWAEISDFSFLLITMKYNTIGDKVEGLGRAKPSQPLKLAPPKHDGRSSATYELPQKIFAYWRF